MVRFRVYHILFITLTLIWIALINLNDIYKVSTKLTQQYTYYASFRSNIIEVNHESINNNEREEDNKQDKFEVFTAVGRKGCKYTVLTDRILGILKENFPEKVFVYSWAAPTKLEFDEWLKTRKLSSQVPKFHKKAPVIFNRLENKRVFLGGVDKLIEYIEIRFPNMDLSKAVEELKILDNENSNRKYVRNNNDNNKNDAVVDELNFLDNNNEIDNNSNLKESSSIDDIEISDESNNSNNEIKSYAKEETKKDFLANPVNALKPQVPLKKQLIYTSYHLTEGKHVTNHKPISMSLKDMGWGFMQSAPLRANWVLVQDQATAAHILSKYRKTIINNIGYGGQSCFGGTKGKQLTCRSEYTKQHGCAYSDLDIQPTQYRLWINDECRSFFEKTCNGPEANRLWMEKPSGGQHGVGMQVRQGCDAIRKVHKSCTTEAHRKKILVMPYLNPALLHGHKFDVRSFLLVGSALPQLVFYHDGFARKANNPYSQDVNDRNAHITNANSQSTNKDHYYSFEQLQKILFETSGFPKDYMTNIFRKHAFKVENFIFQVSKPLMNKRTGIYQIFALDWVIDANGSIHLLEANSNPLVTVYSDLREEYTETWKGMTELVLKIHTKPEELFSEEKPALVTKPDKSRFEYRGWYLIYNELEEENGGINYSPCKEKFDKFYLSLWQKQNPNLIYPDIKNQVLKKLNDTDISLLTSSSNKLKQQKTASSPPLLSKSEEITTTDDEKQKGREDQNDYDETPYKVNSVDIKESIDTMGNKSCSTLDPFTEFKSCVIIDRELKDDIDTTVRCEFTDGGYVYIIEPKGNDGNCLPNIMVTAGVHGNEVAGIVAARYVRKTWRIDNARLIIVERINPKAAEKRGRYIPKQIKKEQDLNRNFPKSGLVGQLAKDIWSLVEKVKPHVFVDMHEGWGVYKRLRANYVKGGPLVGNPKFSKGSSVISSESALPIAQYMANKVNNLTVPDKTRHFLAIVPPIVGGLANKVMREFDSLVVVFETTSGNQNVHFRGQQQVILLGTLFQLLGVIKSKHSLPSLIDGFTEEMACIAGSQNCKLKHTGDKVIERALLSSKISSKIAQHMESNTKEKINVEEEEDLSSPKTIEHMESNTKEKINVEEEEDLSSPKTIESFHVRSNQLDHLDEHMTAELISSAGLSLEKDILISNKELEDNNLSEVLEEKQEKEEET